LARTPSEAVDLALAFLAGRQLATGGFPIQMWLESSPHQAEQDISLFATSLVAHSLGHCDAEPARAMLDRALAYLRSHMEAPGVWRHWTQAHEQYHALPADVDDTACISSVLRRAGLPFPPNQELLLANRDRRGRFFTWLIGRWTPPPAHAGFWRVALRRWRHPLRAILFWRMTSAAPDDVDGVVNANVLQYLGDGPHAPAVVDYLVGIVRRGEEDRCDKWYRSPLVFHYALSRCAGAGVGGVAEVGSTAVERIVAAQDESGRIGDGPLDTALAACALRNWNAGGPARARATAYCLAEQSEDGSWPAQPLYFGGPRGEPAIPRWGSAELTTALCVEALSDAAGP
jgi:hypothetical protein